VVWLVNDEQSRLSNAMASMSEDTSLNDSATHRVLQQATFCLTQLREELLSQRVVSASGPSHWTGKLSASALSTATAVSALAVVWIESANQSMDLGSLVERGCRYLDTQQNADGGYGDTDRSHSNIATSYLVLAARTLASRVVGPRVAGTETADFAALRDYIVRSGELAGLRKRYGKDKTFVVPIMTNLAIAGLVDWADVPRLPFEAAVFPGRFYRFLRMPVVSYAIPALVAIGQVHHFLGPQAIWPIGRIRAAAVAKTTRVLLKMQPESGGYLEATPLTSFVLMSLAASAKARRESNLDEHAGEDVASQCIQFLRDSIRDDGSWPIDTNLATWITSLSIHSLGRWSHDDRAWMSDELIRWHLGCQHLVQHPFTGASPGGWGWTDLSGAVPDGDDTPAAILAAIQYRKTQSRERRREIDLAIANGLRWLADLQNSDGGLPTFCRGWGKLPFDRSSTDLTAHFIRAIDQSLAMRGAGEGDEILIEASLVKRLQRCRVRAIKFLRAQQQLCGAWLPLWFGNQDNHDDENPVYGTARVLLALSQSVELSAEAAHAVDYLLAIQNEDGGWGGGNSVADYRRLAAIREQNASESAADSTSSLEETAVAVEAISDYLRNSPRGSKVWEAGRATACEQAIIDAVEFLTCQVTAGNHRHAWPIGFYFAKLWYYEDLYPLVFTTAALSAAIDALNQPT
jgi:squalene-hopene/tetraprenyl-beta-curcumene cyclase